MRHSHQILTTTLSITLLILAAPFAMAAERTMTDDNISDKVEDELVFDHAVMSHRVNVTADDGIVTLTGTVNNILSKERAARIAETVKGVRSVINQIDVVPSIKHTDQSISNNVLAALADNPATDSWELTVSTSDGVVTLDGDVESATEKELAATVAKSIAGVTGLKNEIDLRYKDERPDSEIEADIQERFVWDLRLDAGLIEVTVKNGYVALTGTIGSAAEKRIARQKAWVAGVKMVDESGLEVASWAREEAMRKNKFAKKTPEEVRNAVLDAMLLDPRVNSFGIGVEINGGNATLRGNVDSIAAKKAAAQVARNTVGVQWVKNRVKVRAAETRSDSEVMTSVQNAIKNDAFLESYEIIPTVSNGYVRLYGNVESNFEKTHAESLVERIYGVDFVGNYLTVENDDLILYDPYVDELNYNDYAWYKPRRLLPRRSDIGITMDIENELYWSPFVDSDDVQVAVENGVATLTGAVQTELERRKAAQNAWEGGAGWVDNELVVK